MRASIRLFCFSILHVLHAFSSFLERVLDGYEAVFTFSLVVFFSPVIVWPFLAIQSMRSAVASYEFSPTMATEPADEPECAVGRVSDG